MNLFTNRQIAAVCCAVVLAVTLALNGTEVAQEKFGGWYKLFLQALDEAGQDGS